MVTQASLSFPNSSVSPPYRRVSAQGSQGRETMRGKGLHRTMCLTGENSAQRVWAQEVNTLGIMGAKFLTVRDVLYLHMERGKARRIWSFGVGIGSTGMSSWFSNTSTQEYLGWLSC